MITEGHRVDPAHLVIPVPDLAHLNILVLHVVGRALEAVAMNQAHLLKKGGTIPGNIPLLSSIQLFVFSNCCTLLFSGQVYFS